MTNFYRGGLFGLNPSFENISTGNLTATSAQINGDANFAQAVNINGTFTLNGTSVTDLSLQGVWNANTNTPSLTTITPTNNQFWIVSEAGSTTLGSISSWDVNDWALYLDGAWAKISAGSRSTFATLAVGDLNLANAVISATGSATDITITPGTNGYLVSEAIKADEIVGSNGSSTGSLQLLSGGNNTMILDESQNVGIGLQTPQSALHVAGTIDASPSQQGVHIGQQNTNHPEVLLSGLNEGTIAFQNSTDASPYSGRVHYNHSANRLSFAANAADVLHVIDSKVGVGVNAPLSAAQVTGTIDVSPGSAGVHMGQSGTSTGMLLAGSGSGFVSFQNANDADSAKGRIFYAHTTDTMSFETDATQRLSIDGSGNAALTGTLTTSSNLTSNGTLSVTGASTLTGALTCNSEVTVAHINGGVASSGNFNIKSTTLTGTVRLFGGTSGQNSGGRIDIVGPNAANDAGKIIVRTGTQTGGQADISLVVHDDGDVGIGRNASAPNAKLDVGGGISLTNPSAQTFYWKMERDSTNGQFMLHNASTERLRVNTTGQTIILGDATPFDNTGSADGLQLYYKTDTGDATIGSYNSSGDSEIIFHTNASSAASTEKMRIKSNGAALIKTSTQHNGATLSLDYFGLAIESAVNPANYRRNYMGASDNLFWTNGSNSASLTSAGVWTDASDSHYKRDVDDIDYGLETINKLKPRSFYMKSDQTNDERHIGFVAQELKDSIPECVFGEEGSMNIAYGRINAVLVKAVQELSHRLACLEQASPKFTA